MTNTQTRPRLLSPGVRLMRSHDIYTDTIWWLMKRRRAGERPVHTWIAGVPLTLSQAREGMRRIKAYRAAHRAELLQ